MNSLCVCFLKDLCLDPFFWTLLNPVTKLLLFFEFLCVRLPNLCFTCVSGLESSFYRHHLDLRKVSTFCTAIVWLVYRSQGEGSLDPIFPFILRGKPDPMNSFKPRQWRSIHCVPATWDKWRGMARNGRYVKKIRSDERSIKSMLEGTWRSEERSIKSALEVTWRSEQHSIKSALEGRWRSEQHSIKSALEGRWRSEERSIKSVLEGTWRSEERSSKSVLEAVWTRRFLPTPPNPTPQARKHTKAGGVLQVASQLH